MKASIVDYIWWLLRVRLKRGSGARVILTRIAGLTLWLAFLASWMVYEPPWMLIEDIASVKIQIISDLGFLKVAPNLAQTSGTFAGFAVTIIVLLFTDMGTNWLHSAAQDIQSPQLRRSSSGKRDHPFMPGLKFIRDISVSMHSIAFFAFTIATLGYSIVEGRVDLTSAAILYSLSSACFYLALLLFFGALVPLFRLSQLNASVPVSRVLFLSATILGGIMVLQSARTPVGTGYGLGISFTVAVSFLLVGPLWAANAFTSLRHRRRFMPSMGIWLTVTLLGLAGAAILVLPANINANFLASPVGWAQMAYFIAALAISLGFAWSMLLGSLDLRAQPYDFPHITVIAVNKGTIGNTQAGLVVCAFSDDSNSCDCEKACAIFHLQDTRSIDDDTVAPLLAAYSAVYFARDYTDRSACILLNNRDIAERLNRSIAAGFYEENRSREQIVVRGIIRLAKSFSHELKFSSPPNTCQRYPEAFELAAAVKHPNK